MKSVKLYDNCFYGNKVSEYGLEHGRVDYAALSKSFDAVLNNNIWSTGWELGEWEIENGAIDNRDAIEELQEQIEELEDLITEDSTPEDDDATTEKIRELQEQIEELEREEEDSYSPEVFQWFIIDNNGVETLKYWTDEPIYYNYALDMYIWGVTFYGTSWSYVLTDIEIEQ